jgi:hypothetical protein
MRVSDDRLKVKSVLVEALGGAVECVYWEVSARALHMVADMPDSESATAAAAVLMGTGAFKNVEGHELMSHEQFSDMLELADSTGQVYKVPGQELLENDSSQERFQYRA